MRGSFHDLRVRLWTDQEALGSVLCFGLGVFVAGYVFFPDGWWHLIWFAVVVAFPWFRLLAMESSAGGGVGPGDALRLMRIPLAAVVLVAFMVLTAPVGEGCGPVNWLLLVLDGVGLLVFLGAVGTVCGRVSMPGVSRILDAYALLAGLTAVFSLIAFYADPANGFPEARLRNLLVYRSSGGLHPVLTGLLFGFGATVAALRVAESRGDGRGPSGTPAAPSGIPRGWWMVNAVLLWGAVFYTHSRGAMLAAAVALVVLLVCRRNRAAATAVGAFLLVAAFYQWGSPHFVDENVARHLAPRGENPVGHLVERGASGRIDLYRHLLARIDSPRKWLIGTGACSPDAVPIVAIGWHAHHPHSAYFSLFFHGGIIAVILFGAVLAKAVRPAFSALRGGGADLRVDALVVLAFGMTGLLFDGADLYSIVSVPRLEPLLFWLPWMLLTVGTFGNGISAGSRADPVASELRD